MKKRISAFLLLFLMCLVAVSPALAAEQSPVPDERLKPLLVDEADILSSSQEEALLARLDEISERQKCDVAVVTVGTTEGKDITPFTDDYFDYNGYGYGSTKDGVMLLIDMGSRSWCISTSGSAIQTFTDAGQKNMTDRIVPYLSDGDFSGAFNEYADMCDDYINQAKTGKPYDVGNLPTRPKTLYERVLRILVSLLGGLVPAGVVTRGMKSQLKPVRRKQEADMYVQRARSDIREGGSVFLRSMVSSTPRSKGSSGGSSTHTSSSGNTHGGSSGHF